MRSVLGLCALLLTASACSSGRGDIGILYTFGGDDCFTAGVYQIDLRADFLGFPGDAELATVRCQDYPDGVSFFLRDGVHRFTVEAYGPSGELLYDTVVNLEVIAGRDVLYEIDVPPSAGTLTLFWTFEGSSSCADVSEVRVLLEDPFGFEYDDAFYPCSFGGVTYEDLIAGDWLATLRAYAPGGAVLYRATERPVVVEAYADSEVTVDLE